MTTYRKVLTFVLIASKTLVLVSSAATNTAVISTPDTSFEECFNKNSISCLQIQIYRNVRSFFDQDRVDLAGGISLVREDGNKNQSKARATEDVIAEEQIIEAEDFERRESTLESFVYRKLIAFFQERSVRWNISPIIDTMTSTSGITENLPDDEGKTVTNFETEGQSDFFISIISVLNNLID